MPDAAGAPLADLLAAARAWAADDPDPVDPRRARRARPPLAEGGDEAAATELADAIVRAARVRHRRACAAASAADPNRMNRAVVIRAAAGLTAYLKTAGPRSRSSSSATTRATTPTSSRTTPARSWSAPGGRAVVLPRPLPTPVLAYAIRHLGADAGVMVTASHNPPEDNGYKVYVGDGSQIVPPVDAADRLRDRHCLVGAPTCRWPDDGWQTLDDSVLDAYLADVRTVVRPGQPARRHRGAHRAARRGDRRRCAGRSSPPGSPAPIPVASPGRARPDVPDGLVPEPGGARRDGRRARAGRADPRPTSSSPTTRTPTAAPSRCPARAAWRMLRGDEVGALLGSHVRRAARPAACADSADASSPTRSCRRGCSRRCAAAAGVRHEETLTGFKWIGRVPGLRYGYEEALGYCVDPGRVRDKDGVCAALLVAELVATLRPRAARSSTCSTTSRVEHGVYATDAFSVRVDDLSLIRRIMERLRADAARRRWRACRWSRADDLARGDGGLPPTEGLRYLLADDSRVIVRPSRHRAQAQGLPRGHRAGAADGDLRGARERPATRLAGIRADLEAATTP